MISAVCSFGWWLMAGAGFVLGEKYCWLVDGGWFVLRENYCCLVPDKPSEHGVQLFFFVSSSYVWWRLGKNAMSACISANFIQQ
jgi:hypothetical protein